MLIRQFHLNGFYIGNVLENLKLSNFQSLAQTIFSVIVSGIRDHINFIVAYKKRTGR